MARLAPTTSKATLPHPTLPPCTALLPVWWALRQSGACSVSLVRARSAFLRALSLVCDLPAWCGLCQSGARSASLVRTLLGAPAALLSCTLSVPRIGDLRLVLVGHASNWFFFKGTAMALACMLCCVCPRPVLQRHVRLLSRSVLPLSCGPCLCPGPASGRLLHAVIASCWPQIILRGLWRLFLAAC